MFQSVITGCWYTKHTKVANETRSNWVSSTSWGSTRSTYRDVLQIMRKIDRTLKTGHERKNEVKSTAVDDYAKDGASEVV